MVCVFVCLFVCLFVYCGATPQQQPGSYRGGDDDNDDKMSVSLVEDTGIDKFM